MCTCLNVVIVVLCFWVVGRDFQGLFKFSGLIGVLVGGGRNFRPGRYGRKKLFHI